MRNQGLNANNIGFLRLLFATLVILSHAPQLVDGNRSREILTSIFGTASFGDFGVDGFFLLSGYLITKSYLGRPSPLIYLTARIRRIVPGYLAAYFLSLLVIGPLVGGSLLTLVGGSLATITAAAVRPLLLMGPLLDGTFAGVHYPELNSSMWTIAYEFRCYIAMLLLGMTGLLRHRRICLGLTTALVVTWIFVSGITFPKQISILIGDFPEDIRLFSVFFVGCLFFLFANQIKYSRSGAAIATLLLIPLMFIRPLAEPALATLGGYVMFWFAFRVSVGLFSVGGRTDLSYGAYLYAWPIENSIAWLLPGISPWALFPLATALSLSAGYASWRLVERPFLRQVTPVVRVESRSIHRASD